MPVVDRREFGGRFSVSENSKRLSNYRYLEIQLMEMLGGWCHTTPAADLPGLPVFLGVTPEAGVGCVTCFVVAKPFRRQGVARALLEAAIAGFAAEGLAAVEAYPRHHSDDEAHHFPGPLEMYRQAGFRVIGETSAIVTRLRVRLDLPRPRPTGAG